VPERLIFGVYFLLAALVGALVPMLLQFVGPGGGGFESAGPANGRDAASAAPASTPAPFTGPALPTVALADETPAFHKRALLRLHPPTPIVPTILLVAARGASWAAVRSGSAAGPTLYEGVLEPGASVRFRADRVWLRLGAAANVDVTLNGDAVPVPQGTVDLLLPSES
jgi:hypothetical protein